jgi:PAS domain S-box-containing protein
MTEKKAWHEQQDWLRVTLSSIGDAVITTDTMGCVTFLNPVAQSLTGWTQEEAKGVPLDDVFKIVNEETRRIVENPATRSLREGLIVGLANHTLLISKDGSERPIDDSAAPIRNAKGDVAGVVLVFRDVTERRSAEKALRTSEQRFRLLVEGTKDYAIFMLDTTGHIISWNPGAERFKGYRADEIIGCHFSRFYPAEDVQRGKPDHELRVAAAQGKYEEEGWRVRKDGTRFWASVIITALEDDAGNFCGFSKITRDLTEKMQAEENVRRLLEQETARQAAEEFSRVIEEQRAQLRVTLESIGDAVIATDAEGRVTLLNKVAEALTGWTNADALGKPLHAVFRIINEKTRQTLENPAGKIFATGRIVGLANHTVLIARDGSERPIDDSAAPIRDGQDNVTGVVLVFRDVTERRRAEKALAESEARKTAIVNTAPDCIITMDQEGKIVEFNPAAERTFGYGRADALGRPMAELIIPPSLRQQHYRGLAHYLATGEGPVLNKQEHGPYASDVHGLRPGHHRAQKSGSAPHRPTRGYSGHGGS